MLRLIPKKALLLFSGDFCLIYAAFFLSTFLRAGDLRWLVLEPSLTGPAIILIYFMSFYLLDVYSFDLGFRSVRYLYRFLAANAAAATAVSAAFFFLPYIKTGRGVLLITTAMAAFFTFSWRLLFEVVFGRFLGRVKNMLIVDAGPAGRALCAAVHGRFDYRVSGFLDDDPMTWGARHSPTVLGGTEMLSDENLTRNISTVVMDISQMKNPDTLKRALQCKLRGILVYDLPTFYEDVMGKLPVEYMDDRSLVGNPLVGVRRNTYNLKGKRVLDIAFSVLGLLLSLPITLPAAAAIKLESKGPVFYRQRRTGYRNRTFEAVKFRSMTVDAEQNGAVWAGQNDARVTKVGRLIRKYRIDEIPQMWNVLRGEMSFIGPRPERPEFVVTLEKKIQYYSLRHSVKPGITGWAQVNYPYGASEEDALEKLKYDLYYINYLSPALDFHILLRTVKIVLFGRGAR